MITLQKNISIFLLQKKLVPVSTHKMLSAICSSLKFNMANKHVLYSQAQEWITTFTSLGSLCQGYQKERVTPYMHIMAYHVPKLMMLHKGIRKFSGQGTYM